MCQHNGRSDDFVSNMMPPSPPQHNRSAHQDICSTFVVIFVVASKASGVHAHCTGNFVCYHLPVVPTTMQHANDKVERKL